MTEQGPIIDTSVQPFLPSNADLRAFLPDALRLRGMPDVESAWYQAPDGDYQQHLYGGEYPGSDPLRVARDVLDEPGVDIAILNPRTRGPHPNYLMNNAICAATNDWLADVWLDKGNLHGRFRGTIRVNPEDARAAIAEIERWEDHPHMVQVGVPMASREVYGKPQFWPIWRAAAERGLPIAISTNGGAGIEFPPTAAGHARTYENFFAFYAYNFFYHLAGIVTLPELQEVPDVVFVFPDGGADVLPSLMWRLDTLWFGLRDQMPWLERPPSEHLRDHFRFGYGRMDGPPDDAITEAWLSQLGLEDVIMFASGYPFWSGSAPNDLPAGSSARQRENVRFQTANELYRLGLTSPAPVSPHA